MGPASLPAPLSPAVRCLAGCPLSLRACAHRSCVCLALRRCGGVRSRQGEARVSGSAAQGQFTVRRQPPGGSVTVSVAGRWRFRVLAEANAIPFTSVPRNQSSVGVPLAASAVRQVRSGGNFLGVFSDTAAGFAAVSSGCFPSFHPIGFPLEFPVRSALPMTSSCASNPSRTSRQRQSYPQGAHSTVDNSALAVDIFFDAGRDRDSALKFSPAGSPTASGAAR